MALRPLFVAAASRRACGLAYLARWYGIIAFILPSLRFSFFESAVVRSNDLSWPLPLPLQGETRRKHVGRCEMHEMHEMHAQRSQRRPTTTSHSPPPQLNLARAAPRGIHIQGRVGAHDLWGGEAVAGAHAGDALRRWCAEVPEG